MNVINSEELKSVKQDSLALKDSDALGHLIDIIFTLKQIKRDIRTAEKEINIALDFVENVTIGKMEKEQLTKGNGELGSASLSAGIYPSVEIKEDFYRWAIEEGRFEMLQSRCNAAAVMELFDKENILPDGIKTYTKQKLNTRKKP